MKQGEKYTFTGKGEGPWKKQTEERDSEMCHASLCLHYLTTIRPKFMLWDQGISL